MSLNFPAANTEYIDLGDITAARFERLKVWSVLSFFRIENTAGDDRCIIAKWGGGGNQFIIRTDAGTEPINLEIWTGGSKTIDSSLNVDLNIWYLVALTNDGTGGTDGMKLYLLNMDGTFLDDATLGTHSSDTGLTTSIQIGVRATSDPMDGDIDYPCYIEKELSKNDIFGYLNDPVRTALRFKADGLPFFLKLGPGEVTSLDWSGSGNSGTINGSPTANQAPPVKLHTIQSGIPLIEVAAGGADTHPGWMSDSGWF